MIPWPRIARVVASVLLVAAAAAPAWPASAQIVDWRDENVYFLMVDRFHNGDRTNDLDVQPGRLDWWQGGDLRGVIERLDYIKDLGMTAIWLTPLTRQTEGGYHGYWTLDFYEIEPRFGDLETLRELATAAHARGLKVILDVVVNHVGYAHPWLTDGQHEGWFHDECDISFGDQRSVEDCWLAGLPDLDTENPDVRRYLIDWSLWLIDQTGIDGYRLDTARHLPRDFIREWREAIRQRHPRFWVLGEVFSADYRYQADFLASGLDALTDFQTYEAIDGALGIGRTDMRRLLAPPALARQQLPEPDPRVTFVDNHDLPRFVGRVEPGERERARLGQALTYLYTMPGIPTLYYGTEIALPGGRDPDNRRPMTWDDPPSDDLRQLTARLAGLRRDNAVLRRGELAELSSSMEHVVYRRTLGDHTVIVALNGTDGQLEVVVRGALAGQHALLPALEAAGARAVARRDGTVTLTLPPRAAQIWSVGAAEPWPPLWSIAVILASLAAIGGAVWRLRSLS